ncbi:PH domain-containing protein [Lysobacter sp. A289]
MTDAEPGHAPVETSLDNAGDVEHRLHPMSWLFVLLAQLRQFIVPLLALLVFGGGGSSGYGDSAWWPLIGVGALALVSLWHYFTYHYRVGDDALVVRSGLLERSVRVIPFVRIHNVALQQSLLHRLFGVAEVRLESAGGTKPEAEMRVLKLDDALALEALVRRRARSSAGTIAPTTTTASATLLELPMGEVLRLGLVSNRGLILLAAAFGGIAQFNGELMPRVFEQWGETLFGWAGERHFGTAEFALAAVSLVVLVVLLLRLLSVALALLQYYGFRLSEQDRRLTVERGLLGRWRTSASRRRIQAGTLHEGLMHRWLGRQSLKVDTAVAEQQNQSRALRDIAPIATPRQCADLIRNLLPRGHWDQLDWQPVPVISWVRRWLPSLPLTLLVAALLGSEFGRWGLLALAWLPWAAFKARRRAAWAAWALGDELVAVREGWLDRHWRFAEIDKLQALRLSRNPLDRYCGTASVWLDTAGAGATSLPLRIRFVPEAQALAIYQRLSAELAHRRLRW